LRSYPALLFCRPNCAEARRAAELRAAAAAAAAHDAADAASAPLRQLARAISSHDAHFPGQQRKVREKGRKSARACCS
jgi:hypothetical protein